MKDRLLIEPDPPFVREIAEGVWEIVDELGNSTFSTHCVDCGNPFFFGDLRLMNCVVVCQDCKKIRNTPLMEDRDEVLYPSAHDAKVIVDCSKCGESMVRSQAYIRNPTCSLCRELAQREQRKAYA